METVYKKGTFFVATPTILKNQVISMVEFFEKKPGHKRTFFVATPYKKTRKFAGSGMIVCGQAAKVISIAAVGFLIYFVTLGSIVMKTIRKLLLTVGACIKLILRPFKLFFAHFFIILPTLFCTITNYSSLFF